MKQDKIATVTVTYNRKDLLLENIQAILNQDYHVDCIIIVDNHSTDKTQEAVLEKYPNSNIDYLYLEENIGGAGGFYTGCKYAYEKGYDWIILMDDDGRPQNSATITNLMEVLENKKITSNNLVMLNSLVLADDGILTFGLFGLHDSLQSIQSIAEENMIRDKVNPFNGTLISKGLVKEIGFPNKDFFIGGDEQEYFYRAMQANAFVATIITSLYYHPVGDNKKRKIIHFLGKEYRVYSVKPWREYYNIRNTVYMYKKTGNKKAILKLFIERIIGISLLSKGNRIESLKMLIKGYKDGVKGNLGATIKPS